MPRRDEATEWLPGIEWSGMAPAPQPADFAQRRCALDPETSFIVQAPAGSGKTALLIQRYLVLLARAAQPEQIVAITFTVKAAAEMRSRVLEALRRNSPDADAAGAPDRFTLELAHEALHQDARQGWNLAGNPERLRIQTIDALSMGITRQMPWLSRFGAMPDVTEDARPMYREAARRTVETLGGADDTAAGVACLLEHLDTDATRAVDLIAGMLETRDHWLRVLGSRPDSAAVRRTLETSLRRIVSAHLERLRRAVPPERIAEMLELARYAGSNVRDSDQSLARCAGLTALPDSVEGWLGLGRMLLTGEGEWRARVDRRTGFPPHDKRMKQRFDSLIQDLSPAEAFRGMLGRVPELPSPVYEESQWRVLSALFALLPVTVARLRTVFAEAATVDFIEIAEAARYALGDAEHPTDLALAMGAHINHLLLDEFQDTSVTQFALLRALTAEWEPGDGRTLFLVGDPMQSVYRFRQAEVALFLNVRESGVGALRPESLGLNVNFRSARTVVEWVNRTFFDVLPREADADTGAVPYTASEAFREGAADSGVTVHPFVGRDDRAEANLVLDLVQRARREQPESRIAILVRARKHLAAIADRLREGGVVYRAIEIQALAERPVIQDLLALTRALSHLGDRVAWLAVLRAPWCGLTLADLYRVAGTDRDRTVWSLLGDPAPALDPEGAERLARILPALSRAFAMRGRVPVATLVERTWIALGGDRLADTNDRRDASAFFGLLEEVGLDGDIGDLGALSERVRELFAKPDAGSDGCVELMTIHKAKGLEFDTVILPGLGKPPKVDEPSLLVWSERSDVGQTDLLLAPISARRNGSSDRLYDFIRRGNDEKARHESERLLYVACTRAKSRLHLIGHVGARMDGRDWILLDPPRDSLLAHIWGIVRPEFERVLTTARTITEPAVPAQRTPRPLRRTRLDSIANEVFPVTTPAPAGSAQIRLDEPGTVLRRVGTVVHRLLDRIARDGIAAWNGERIRSLRPGVHAVLAGEGVAAGEIHPACDRIESALLRTVNDPMGQWILGPRQHAQSEFAVSGLIGEEVCHLVIDRTFLAPDGVRWIVDFKTSEPGDLEVEAFLESEKSEYAAQLRRYATLLAGLGRGAIRVVLYFPMIGKWVAWDPL